MFELPLWVTPVIIIASFIGAVYVVTWTIGMFMFIWCTPRDQLEEMIKPRSQRIREALARASVNTARKAVKSVPERE